MAASGATVPEGISEKDRGLKDSIDSLDGELKELAKAVIALNTSTIDLADANDDDKEGQKGFLGELREEFSGVFSDLSGAFGFGDKKKAGAALGDKKATKVKPKAEDLLNLPERDALGALLIANKLDELKDSQGKKDKKEGGLGDVFKGLLKGAAGIALLAVSLIVFAGAAVLFGMVNWGPAIIGLALFAGFVVGAIVLSKLMGKHLKDFQTLALGSALLSVGLMAFSLALIVTAKAAQVIMAMGPGGIAGLIVILGMYCAFVLGAAALGQVMEQSTKYLVNLAIGGTLLSVGLMVFSLALVVVSALAKYIDVPAVLGTLVLYGSFVLGVALLGKLLGENSKSLQDLAIGAILMAVGLVVFALALYIVQEIRLRIDMNNVLPILGLFAVFVGAIAGLGILVGQNMKNIIMLAVGALIMTAALFLFSATLLFINDKITDQALIQGLKVLGMMGAFLLAFGLVGAILANTPVLIYIALTVVAMLGISLAMVAFSKTLAVMEANPVTGATYQNALLTLGVAGVLMAGMIPLGLVAMLAIPATVLFTAWALMAAAGFASLSTVVDVLTKESFVAGIGRASSFLKSKDQVSISSFVNDVVDAIPNPITMALFAVKLGLFEAMTVNMAGSFLALEKVINSIDYIRNKMPSDQDMAPVLTLMERVVKVTSQAIDSVKNTSAEALKAIGQTVADVCKGIDTMADVVNKLKSISPADIDAGSNNIRLMITRLFGDGQQADGLWTITTLFQQLKHVGAGAGPAAQALVPITTSLEAMSNTVRALVGIDGLDEGINNARKVGLLMAQLAQVFSQSAGDTGGWFSSSSSERLVEAKKSFDQIGEIIVGPVKTIANGIQGLDAINGLGKKIDGVMPSDVEGFPGRMKKFSSGMGEFKKGMENLDKVSNVKLDRLTTVQSTLASISKITLVDTLRPLTDLLNREKDLDRVKTSLKEIQKLSKDGGGGMGMATVSAAPKLQGSESVRDLVMMIYQQLFEGAGVKISNWPSFKEQKGGLGQATEITPVQNFLG